MSICHASISGSNGLELTLSPDPLGRRGVLRASLDFDTVDLKENFAMPTAFATTRAQPHRPGGSCGQVERFVRRPIRLRQILVLE